MKLVWPTLLIAACGEPETSTMPTLVPTVPTSPDDTAVPAPTGDTGLQPEEPEYACFSNQVRVDLATDDVVLTSFTGFDDTFDEPLPIYIATDNDGDQVPDVVVRQEYDDRGFLVARRTERDGKLSNVLLLENDDRGNVIVGRTDNDVDGIFDAVVTMTYDANDLVLTRFTDYDGDDVADRTETFDREPDGRLLLQTLRLGEDVSRTTAYTYDDQDRVVLVVQDDSLVDTFDYRVTYEYVDAKGPDHTRTTDQGDDGTPDLVEGLTYDARDRVVQIDRDSDADGVTDVVVTNSWDDEDRLVTRRIDPGEPSLVEVTTNTWDARGRLVRTLVRQPPDGPVVAGTDDQTAYGGTCE